MEDLLDLEIKSLEKTENLIRDSGGTLAISRLKKGHQIIALSRTIRLLIEQNMEDEAEILITLLEEMGVTIPGRKSPSSIFIGSIRLVSLHQNPKNLELRTCQSSTKSFAPEKPSIKE